MWLFTTVTMQSASESIGSNGIPSNPGGSQGIAKLRCAWGPARLLAFAAIGVAPLGGYWLGAGWRLLASAIWCRLAVRVVCILTIFATARAVKPKGARRISPGRRSPSDPTPEPTPEPTSQTRPRALIYDCQAYLETPPEPISMTAKRMMGDPARANICYYQSPHQSPLL